MPGTSFRVIRRRCSKITRLAMERFLPHEPARRTCHGRQRLSRHERGRVVSLCALCGVPNPVGDGVCAHHLPIDLTWAAANRVFCDFLHRRIEPPPAPLKIDLDEALELMAEN